jgi:hypothetical protein
MRGVESDAADVGLLCEELSDHVELDRLANVCERRKGQCNEERLAMTARICKR